MSFPLLFCVEKIYNNQKVIAKGLMHQIIQYDVKIGNKTKVFEKAVRAPGTRLIIVDGNKILLSKEWREEQKKWIYACQEARCLIH